MLAVAAGAFYPLGFTISPMISTAAMSISSIVVVLISNTMRFFTIDPSARSANRRSNLEQSEVNYTNIRDPANLKLIN
jgi:Cu+-exporting ATPase